MCGGKSLNVWRENLECVEGKTLEFVEGKP